MFFKLTQPKFWYKKNIISYILLPFSFIYRAIIRLRKSYYQFFPTKKLPVPIIIVGNITVGGTGKTPLVIYLAEFLKSKGYSPGIVSRGYGGKSKNYPLAVTSESKVEETGDEAFLLRQRTKCPVVIAPKRIAAVNALLLKENCNVIISDDGLQHYALPRDIEIAVIDAELGFGNKFCLPAGPLREPLKRLRKIDFIIKNCNTGLSESEYNMALEPVIFYNIKNPKITKKINEFKNQTVHAFAGIGNPKRFFQTLRQLGLNVIEHSFPDHYTFRSNDFSLRNEIIIMTEKDAVKCDAIATENCWCLKIEAKLSDKFNDTLLNKLNINP
jgi:tetraacyldisaccharide 4'-kinase